MEVVEVTNVVEVADVVKVAEVVKVMEVINVAVVVLLLVLLLMLEPPFQSWKKTNTVKVQSLNNFVFPENEGLIQRMQNNVSCIDFLNLYFTKQF